MAKTKTPFFSLGSHGSIANTLTSQKRGAATLIRKKPTPAYRYTLLQAYQRWLYEDYAYLWRQQSQATRQEYATAGTRFHLTGFQYWMKYHLTNLPDIVSGYRLDEKSGTTAIDFGKNTNHGTIIGASPADGIIGGSFLFDGLNDLIDLHNHPLMNFGTTSPFSAELFFKTDRNSAYNQRIMGKFLLAEGVTFWGFYTTVGVLNWYNIDAVASPHNIWDGQWHYLCGQRQPGGGTIEITVDEDAPVTAVSPNRNMTWPAPLSLGRWGDLAGGWADGWLDNVIIYNRYLDTTERRRHALRRYPP